MPRTTAHQPPLGPRQLRAVRAAWTMRDFWSDVWVNGNARSQRRERTSILKFCLKPFFQITHKENYWCYCINYVSWRSATSSEFNDLAAAYRLGPWCWASCPVAVVYWAALWSSLFLECSQSKVLAVKASQRLSVGKKCRSIRVAPFCARLVAPHICHMKVGGFVATIDHARSCLLLRVEPPSDLPSRKCAKFMLFIDTTSDGLKNMVYFDPYLKKWSNLTIFFSNRLEPPTRNTWVLRLRPFKASIRIYLYIYINHFKDRKLKNQSNGK